MSLPPLVTPTDIGPFAEQLLSSPELWELVEAFSDGREGMAQRRSELSEIILRNHKTDPEGTLYDPDRPTERDAVAQAGLVLASWTFVEDCGLPPKGGTPAARMNWLKRFAARRWDFRVGQERDFIPARQELLNPRLTGLVYSLARSWGMRTPEPAHGTYDHVIVLGGLLRANFNRPAAAAEMIAGGAVSTRSVVGLGAPRPMSRGELLLAEQIGCSARTEQAALEAGLEQAFGFGTQAWESTGSSNLRQAQLADGTVVRSAGAPINPDGSRANTGGAFGWFMEESRLVQPGQDILSVTTPIYWIAGQISLMTKVPPGTTVTTVGADPANALPGLSQTMRSQHFLQEIKSAIDMLAGSLDQE